MPWHRELWLHHSAARRSTGSGCACAEYEGWDGTSSRQSFKSWNPAGPCISDFQKTLRRKCWGSSHHASRDEPGLDAWQTQAMSGPMSATCHVPWLGVSSGQGMISLPVGQRLLSARLRAQQTSTTLRSLDSLRQCQTFAYNLLRCGVPLKPAEPESGRPVRHVRQNAAMLETPGNLSKLPPGRPEIPSGSGCSPSRTCRRQPDKRSI